MTPRIGRKTLALLLAALVAVAVAVTLLASRGDEAPGQVVLGEPRIVSAEELSSYARSVKRPVYWAGAAAAGFKIELTEVRGGRVYIRYLTAQAQAGDPRAAFTTLATYPMRGAYEQLRSASRRRGAVFGKTASGGATLHYRRAPSNVYLAQPGADHLVEVFTPEPRAAQRLAASADVAQVP